MTSKWTEGLERWGAYLDGRITYADAQDEDLPLARCRLAEGDDGKEFDWNDEDRVRDADRQSEVSLAVCSSPLVTATRALAAYKVNDTSEHAELSRYVSVGLNAGMAMEQASSWALEVFWASDNRRPALTCSVIPPESQRFRVACNTVVAAVAAGSFVASGGLEWLAWILLHWRLM